MFIRCVTALYIKVKYSSNAPYKDECERFILLLAIFFTYLIRLLNKLDLINIQGCVE